MVCRRAFYLPRATRSRVMLTLMSQPLNPAEQSRLSQRMAVLRQEHRDLDGVIERLAADIQADELALKRLKKRKLQLKDQIAWIENALIPDEPA